MHREFTFHRLNDVGIAKAQQIAQAYDALLSSLLQTCPEGRELALARTKLEESCFFAKKAVANETAYQEA